MTFKKIGEINRDLDFAKHNLNGLIALFGYNDPKMVDYNKQRALSMIDCLTNIMDNLKKEF